MARIFVQLLKRYLEAKYRKKIFEEDLKEISKKFRVLKNFYKE